MSKQTEKIYTDRALLTVSWITKGLILGIFFGRYQNNSSTQTILILQIILAWHLWYFNEALRNMDRRDCESMDMLASNMVSRSYILHLVF